jgi:hypothetical protein
MIKQEISKYRCISREPEAKLRLYSREHCFTIDKITKNGKIAYIYPRPITTAKSRLVIKKHYVCMFTSRLHLQSLDGCVLASDAIRLLTILQKN